MQPAGTGSNQTQIDKLTARLADPVLERRYLAARRDGDLKRFRVSAGLACAANMIFVLLDLAVIPEDSHMAVATRLVTAFPGAGAIYAMTYVETFKQRQNILAWIAIGAATLSYGYLNLISDTPDEYLSGYVIIQMFLFFILPLNFVTSITIGAVCTLVFALSFTAVRDLAFGSLLTIYSQYLVVLLVGGFAVHQLNVLRRGQFLNEIEIERQKSQYFELLTRILPGSIVARMERGEERIADNVPEAVVLFADVVGFTSLAARNTPEAVVASLDGLFNTFDRLVDKHGLEKIKTIGDAYMVAGGVPQAQPDPAGSAARLALDMLAVAKQHQATEGERLQIRVGLHCGPVLAGVIGQSRVGYDLWGDTVNLASRLQALAEPGTALVSAAMRQALDDRFNLATLGPREIKGLGNVPVWRLTGPAT